MSESDQDAFQRLTIVEGSRPKTITVGVYGTMCRSFKFTDSNDNEILQWVGRQGGDETTITLSDNEMLVGIYGRKTAGFTRSIAFSFMTATYKRK